jgi:uncharacterized protein (DUF934 family)
MLPEHVIRHGRVEDDRWRFVGVDPAEGPGPLPEGAIVVPLATWAARRDELVARATPVGVWLGPADDPFALAVDAAGLPLIAVQFPKFADGRGYSTAVLLRTRIGYRGELRAFGDVGRDQLLSLARCGFDAFSLAPHRDPEAALAAFQTFSLRYQGSVDDPVPLFRKRLAARAAP